MNGHTHYNENTKTQPIEYDYDDEEGDTISNDAH